MEPYLAIKIIIALVFIIAFAMMLKGTGRRGNRDGGSD